MEVNLVLSTAGSLTEGKKIARRLVEEGLAACVNVIPGVFSFFSWEGKLCQEREVLILAKTRKSNNSKIIRKIKELHSYEVPEVLFLPLVGGEEKYLQWVRQSVKKRNKKNY